MRTWSIYGGAWTKRPISSSSNIADNACEKCLAWTWSPAWLPALRRRAGAAVFRKRLGGRRPLSRWRQRSVAWRRTQLLRQAGAGRASIRFPPRCRSASSGTFRMKSSQGPLVRLSTNWMQQEPHHRPQYMRRAWGGPKCEDQRGTPPCPSTSGHPSSSRRCGQRSPLAARLCSAAEGAPTRSWPRAGPVPRPRIGHRSRSRGQRREAHTRGERCRIPGLRPSKRKWTTATMRSGSSAKRRRRLQPPHPGGLTTVRPPRAGAAPLAAAHFQPHGKGSRTCTSRRAAQPLVQSLPHRVRRDPSREPATRPLLRPLLAPVPAPRATSALSAGLTLRRRRRDAPRGHRCRGTARCRPARHRQVRHRRAWRANQS